MRWAFGWCGPPDDRNREVEGERYWAQRRLTQRRLVPQAATWHWLLRKQEEGQEALHLPGFFLVGSAPTQTGSLRVQSRLS